MPSAFVKDEIAGSIWSGNAGKSMVGFAGTKFDIKTLSLDDEFLNGEVNKGCSPLQR
ncbi:MAG: hypothetical protein ACREFE_04570 [Limisphaerales bacterium]